MKSPMLRRPLIALSALLPALLVAGVALAADDKWEITSSMEMPGMPFQMPPTKQIVCVPPGQSNEKLVPKQDNCKVSGFKVTGSTSRYHIECAPPQQMSGDGEMTVTGKDAYRGSLNAKANMDGEQTEMKMTYSGRKLGTCTGAEKPAVDVKAIQQQQQAGTAQACGEMAEGMQWRVAPTMAPVCPTLQADICKRAKAKFAKAKTSAGLVTLQGDHPDWKDIAKYCGVDPATLIKPACADAKRAQNWNDAVLVCGEDAELEATAKKECVGMSFTGNPKAVAYRPLCEHYADKLPKGSYKRAPADTDEETEDAGDAAPASAHPLQDTGAKAVEGLKKFKGLFGH